MTVHEFLFLKRHDVIFDIYHKINDDYKMCRVVGKAHRDPITGDFQIKLTGVNSSVTDPVITFNDLEHYIMTPGLQRQFNGYHGFNQPQASTVKTSF